MSDIAKIIEEAIKEYDQQGSSNQCDDEMYDDNDETLSVYTDSSDHSDETDGVADDVDTSSTASTHKELVTNVTDDHQVDESFPKHLRLRYWTSWEEMRLVELWGRHVNEVVVFDRNIPIYRTIMEGMREYGFIVNSQECRRRISSMRNKYHAEHRRLQSEPVGTLSDWRMYTLIDCILNRKDQNLDYEHEKREIDLLMSKINVDRTNEPSTNTESAIKKPAVTAAKRSRKRRYPTTTQRPTDSTTTCLTNMTSLIDGSITSKTLHDLLLHHDCTKQGIAELREENRRLAERCVIDNRRLHLEEQEVTYLETFFRHFKRQNEQLMQSLMNAYTVASTS